MPTQSASIEQGVVPSEHFVHDTTLQSAPFLAWLSCPMITLFDPLKNSVAKPVPSMWRRVPPCAEP